MASAVSLSGSMVIRMGVKFGRDLILSLQNKNKRVKSAAPPSLWLPQPRRYGYGSPSLRLRSPRLYGYGGGFTDLVHHLDHLLQLVGTDVGTVGEAEVDEDPLAQEVLAAPGLAPVVGERERAPQGRTPHRLGPFFFDDCG